MDNKKWYKRFGTLFWWIFTILPLLIALIYFIGYHLTFNSGIATAQELASYQSNINGDFLYYYSDIISSFDDFSFSPLSTTFQNLFNLIGVSSYTDLGMLFGWMVSVQLYHLAFDLFAWLPKFFHRLLEKSDIGE